jgi:aspartokinase/homoserine dehydrogenase 1
MDEEAQSIHKFGGSSVSDAAGFLQVCRCLLSPFQAVVVSATAGTTEALQQLLRDARAKIPPAESLSSIKCRHLALIDSLIPAAKQSDLKAQLEKDCDEINAMLEVVDLLQDHPAHISEKVLGYGEIWSTKILTVLLAEKHKSLVYLDASEIIVVYQAEGTLQVDWEKSQANMDQVVCQYKGSRFVITGFIAQTREGKKTILGRNGSDFTAAIFSCLLKAKKIVIWTNVDGVFSADPMKVRSAFVLPEMSYQEALELSYFGAKVLHPKTLAPAMKADISIQIKNTFNPSARGTCISRKEVNSTEFIRGLSSIEDIAMMTVEGTGMIGVSGTAASIFSELQSANISVIFISQASSEHSICFMVKKFQADLALRVLNERLSYQIDKKHIDNIKLDKTCAIIAVVGDGMVGRKGIMGRLCSTLAKSNVNIRAVAQGSSERNISIVVDEKDVQRALRAVHAGFYLSNKTISVGIIGPGGVGGALLDQMNQAALALKKNHAVNLLVRGIMNSTKMSLEHEGIDLSKWQQSIKHSTAAADVDRFVDFIGSDDMPHSVIIDCTASQAIADLYPLFIEKGLHVITPNKKSNSGPLDRYHALKKLVRDHHRHYLYETTVCAGLPVIKTLQDIIATGDQVEKIEAVVSGTLSTIFNELAKGRQFSVVIKEAKEKGYTEPDPRDDLSGMDVARKMICLARELGVDCSLEAVQVKNLVPEKLRAVSVEEFMTQLPSYDEAILKSIYEGLPEGTKPIYAGMIAENGEISIDIVGVGETHPFYKMTGTDTMVLFKTRRYHAQPLVIQGPGAGLEVTAGGIFADLLRLVSLIAE